MSSHPFAYRTLVPFASTPITAAKMPYFPKLLLTSKYNEVDDVLQVRRRNRPRAHGGSGVQ